MPTKLEREHYLKCGICPRCKCRKLKESYTSCEVCLAATKEWMERNRGHKDNYNKERYNELKGLGLCVSCKKPTEGNVYCRLCTDKLVRFRAVNRPLHSRNKWSKR